jgi:hypothetical protein
VDIAGLAAAFVAERTPIGIFLEPSEVEAQAIAAARIFAGWAELQDATATTTQAIVGTTDLTTGEWSIIKPLFMLYVERETALVNEASRMQGVEPIGRASSEVGAEITAYEQVMPQLAYREEPWSVGLPPDA